MNRDAAAVLGNVGNTEDVALPTRVLDDSEPLVREYIATALGRFTIDAPVDMPRRGGRSTGDLVEI